MSNQNETVEVKQPTFFTVFNCQAIQIAMENIHNYLAEVIRKHK
jgi:hypothetical protein